jgi:drug/metabolite transporter (DMT)-like permease
MRRGFFSCRAITSNMSMLLKQQPDTAQAARALLLLHLCVVLWGFTAILGKWISISALHLVLWRVLLAGLCLLLVMRWRGIGLAKLSAREAGMVVLSGALIALHWLTFYASVKWANASIGVLCMCCAPIFSALLSPLFDRARLRWSDLALALGVLPGMLAVVGGVSAEFYSAIAIGVLSAALVSGFGLVNKALVSRMDVITLSTLQMFVSAALLLIPALIIGLQFPTARDWPALVLFAVVCTALPFVWAAWALRHLSAFSAQFAINLEPIYGIAFAALLLNESSQLSLQFYLGAAAIIAAVALQGYLQLREKSKASAYVNLRAE